MNCPVSHQVEGDQTATETEIVLMIGPPASGKSTRSKQLYPSYMYVNQDTLKTKQKCIVTAREALSKRCSVVVDNTNTTSESRKDWIKLANEYGVAVSGMLLYIMLLL